MQRATRKYIRVGMFMAVVAAVGAGSAQAQPPVGGQGAPGGPGGMRPGGPGGPGMGMAGPFGKWMEDHKNVMGISRKLRGIQELNKTPDTKLNKQQATKMLTIINAWKNKPNMTEEQAKDVDGQITALLNDKQRKQLAAQRPGGFGGGQRGGGKMAGGPGGGKMAGGPGGGKMAGGPGAPGGPGGMRPGGPGGPGGMRPGGPGGAGGQGFTLPKTMNPLNPSSLPAGRMQDRAKQTLAEFTADLQKQAK